MIDRLSSTAKGLHKPHGGMAGQGQVTSAEGKFSHSPPDKTFNRAGSSGTSIVAATPRISTFTSKYACTSVCAASSSSPSCPRPYRGKSAACSCVRRRWRSGLEELVRRANISKRILRRPDCRGPGPWPIRQLRHPPSAGTGHRPPHLVTMAQPELQSFRFSVTLALLPAMQLPTL